MEEEEVPIARVLGVADTAVFSVVLEDICTVGYKAFKEAKSSSCELGESYGKLECK